MRQLLQVLRTRALFQVRGKGQDHDRSVSQDESDSSAKPPGRFGPRITKENASAIGKLGGRPKTMSAYLKQRFGRNGEQLLKFVYAIAAGDVRSTARDRLEATKILLDRGWGKPVDTVVTMDLDGAAAREHLGISEVELMSVAAGNVRVIEGELLAIQDALPSGDTVGQAEDQADPTPSDAPNRAELETF